MRARARSLGRPIAAILTPLVLVACASTGSSPSATASTQASVATASAAPTTPEASPTWPPGGPAPAALEGVWYFPLHSSTITLTGNDYQVAQTDPTNSAAGKIVVNGDEIDFFNGPCGQLPGHLGRYRWTLHGTSSVEFTPLNEDPCGRVDILVNATWTRTPSPAPSG